MGVAGRTFTSSECPECGSLSTPTQNTGHDEDGRTIRRRVCEGCGKIFGTIEIVMPDEFSFSRTDTFRKRDRRGRVAFFSVDRVLIGSVKIVRGKRTDWCGRGLHKLTGKNLRLYDNKRHCRACENIARRKYHFEHRDEINRLERERYHRRKAQAA